MNIQTEIRAYPDYLTCEYEGRVLAIIYKYGEDGMWDFNPLVQGSGYRQSYIPLKNAIDMLVRFQPSQALK